MNQNILAQQNEANQQIFENETDKNNNYLNKNKRNAQILQEKSTEKIK